MTFSIQCSVFNPEFNHMVFNGFISPSFIALVFVFNIYYIAYSSVASSLMRLWIFLWLAYGTIFHIPLEYRMSKHQNISTKKLTYGICVSDKQDWIVFHCTYFVVMFSFYLSLLFPICELWHDILMVVLYQSSDIHRSGNFSCCFALSSSLKWAYWINYKDTPMTSYSFIGLCWKINNTMRFYLKCEMMKRELDMDIYIVICLHVASHLILIHASKYLNFLKKLNTQWYLISFSSNRSNIWNIFHVWIDLFTTIFHVNLFRTWTFEMVFFSISFVEYYKYE